VSVLLNVLSRFVADVFEVRSFEEIKHSGERCGHGIRGTRSVVTAGCRGKTENSPLSDYRAKTSKCYEEEDEEDDDDETFMTLSVRVRGILTLMSFTSITACKEFPNREFNAAIQIRRCALLKTRIDELTGYFLWGSLSYLRRAWINWNDSSQSVKKQPGRPLWVRVRVCIDALDSPEAFFVFLTCRPRPGMLRSCAIFVVRTNRC